MELKLSVSAEDNCRKIKYILRDRLLLSTSLLRRIKTSGSLLLNGEPVFADCCVSTGDAVTVVFPPEKADFPPEEAPISVIWEDEFFLAVNKPAGLITHPTHSRCTGTLANYILSYVLSEGCESCHAVNRLDRDTSGVVLFAKSAYAKSLTFSMEFEKSYLAIVFSVPEKPEGTVDLPIKRLNETDMRRITAPDGAPSVTHYSVIRSDGRKSLLGLRLETGRTHQIRVHMAAIGNPLLGDRLYGTEESIAFSEKEGIKRQLLHAERLSFIHPITDLPVSISVPPPMPDFIF